MMDWNDHVKSRFCWAAAEEKLWQPALPAEVSSNNSTAED
jgi:hypothetical protein